MSRPRLTRQQSREQTRQRLLDAAKALFAERGLGATSVEHITLAAGYSRGAFYSNFRDKPAIFLEPLQREHERILAGLHAILEESATQPPDDRRARLEARLLDYYVHIHRDVPLYTLYLEARLQASRDPDFRGHFRSFQQNILDTVASFAATFATEAGLALTLTPQQIALGFMALCDGIGIYHWPGEETARERDAELVLAEFMQRVGFGRGPA
jgi:AcrR family transcriptional regulator